MMPAGKEGREAEAFLTAQAVIVAATGIGARAGARAPDVVPTPREKRPAISEGLKSRLGPRADDQPFPNKGRPGSRSGSRSKSSGSSLSRSPDSVPPKRRGRAASRSRSSSPSGQHGFSFLRGCQS
ncbi:hypothetical protein OIU74_010142 [Salix koriyanagi]|uniref:Uncharacterized protein n=1 Tax=Salix koriyanagi TaxID=2511006 RepID=A0A9Q0QM03_9ROSI|nr:hypothetical protein OIU74_010142 [Salix koriyanagi]